MIKWFILGFCLLSLFPVTNYYLSKDFPHNTTSAEAIEYLESQDYKIVSNTYEKYLCKKTKYETLYGAMLTVSKNDAVSKVIVCNYKHWIYEWAEDDPAHVGNKIWVDTVDSYFILTIK